MEQLVLRQNATFCLREQGLNSSIVFSKGKTITLISTKEDSQESLYVCFYISPNQLALHLKSFTGEMLVAL